MGLDESKLIDLSKYGGEGYVEMAYPPLRRKDKYMRQAAAMMVTTEKDRPEVRTEMLLDAQFVQKLAYLEMGPFDSLETFYDFTDKLDAKRRGAGEEFKEEFIRIADEIAEGRTSPSAGSPEAE